jgi:PHD/YefM family antitoxin component YafN of YafNO toxin-antitoxin module
MNTKLIGLKEFRLNLAKYTKQVESGKVRLIVLKKNKPVLEINPIITKEYTLENLQKEINEAQEQYKNGEVYTAEEVEKELGL